MQLFVFLLTVFFVTPTWAASYKYDSTTLQIVAVSDTPFTGRRGQAGFGNLTLSGDVAWPAPRGCSKGRQGWTEVDQHPNPTRLIVKPGLLLFRCNHVTSAADVDVLVDQESKALCDAFPQPDPLVAQLKLDVDRVCEGDTADSGDCADARTAYSAVVTARERDAAADKAEAKRLTEAIQTLHTEAETFKDTQGW